MAAEAAVSMAVDKLANLAIQKVSELRGVEPQVVELKDELQMMQCFLRDASERQAKDERIRKWISDVRDVAFDAEDVIDTFALKIDAPRKKRGALGSCVGFPEHMHHLDKLGNEIKSIKKRLKDIDERRVRYGFQSLDDEAARTATSFIAVERRRRVSPWQPDKHVIGFDGHVETLLQKAILVKREGLCIASIVGMGGVGKSTLAKKVYNHRAVVQQFESHAWVTVSRDFRPMELLKKLALQLKPRRDEKTNIENLPEELLEQVVYKRLQGTQYFIVVDDVWKREDWGCIARAFPDETDIPSRVLITSRVHNISRSAQYVHELKGLDHNQSWELFLKAAFVENEDGKCPSELEDIGRRIVRKCDGLPLAISVIGGLLLEQGLSVSRWERVLKGIKSHLEVGEDSVSPILELSYQDLSPHLKSCFLYLSLFKEDVEIMTKTLIELWIAEGIVPQGKEGETMEEMANGYFDELINRNMVLAVKWFGDNQVVLCRVHDLLRDLSIIKAKEEINFDFLSDENTSVKSLDNKARHLAIRCNNKRSMSSWTPNPRTRSLFFWESTYGYDFISLSYWKKLGGRLRVLEMGGLMLTMVPKGIGRLTGLKYLGLRNNLIQRLPRSLGNLCNLQTLDISENEFVKVPNVIWKLDSLRFLYLSNNMICDEPLKLDTLKNLQILINVSLQNIVVEDLANMVNLRELDLHTEVKHHVYSASQLKLEELVKDLRLKVNVDVNKLFTSLAKLKNLVATSLNWSIKLVLHSGTFGPINSQLVTMSMDEVVNLQHLKLSFCGKLEKLPHQFPQNLSYLNLTSTDLNEDSMKILGKLSNLLHLKLDRDSYVGEEMVIVQDGFPRLKVLIIQHMWKLRQMHVETGGLIELKQLGIIQCESLEIFPEEEDKRIMGSLQTLMIHGQSKIASKSHIISNIPSVEIF